MTDDASSEVNAYDRWHEQRRKFDVASPLEFPWYQSVYQSIGNRLHGSVLEVGCGRGDFAVWLSLRRPDLRIAAVDFSGAAMTIAQSLARSEGASVDFQRADAESLPFEDKSFDFVISCECIEHVLNPKVMTSEIARVTKPGGHFCLTTENYLNGMFLQWLVTWLTGRPMNTGSGVQPRENFFVFWMVRRYLQKAGLVVDRMESCHYQWLLLPRVAPATLCTQTFSKPWLRRLALPFGRHFTFIGHKPATE